ncbi:SIMPL domain-containing protein [Flavobacterium orientale]|uniref:SIMPL domain-containing protein n=1 Tax=Flavobacterium orientale TaxID=1756020 RepID=A0A917DD26_9FLAO|nr:SIMPL domain-containing protein [Flavobacterium orientale]GGD26568.1 SIMPL domain-containing protein [Flavobacterium orientale]
MKKIVLFLFLVAQTTMFAQESKQVPQISVNGEGRVKVVPDRVEINLGVKNLGKDAAEVKKLNDETVDKVLKYIKKFGIPASDFKTTQVSLNRTYDYDKKKQTYQASQTIAIVLKDLTKYDELMMGLMDNGVNSIDNVEFKSSKMEQHKSEARKLAIIDAKKKAEDYVSVLNQKVGKAILIMDNSSHYQPPMYKNTLYAMEASDSSSQQTLAIGEIDILTNVSVSFVLE